MASISSRSCRRVRVSDCSAATRAVASVTRQAMAATEPSAPCTGPNRTSTHRSEPPPLSSRRVRVRAALLRLSSDNKRSSSSPSSSVATVPRSSAGRAPSSSATAGIDREVTSFDVQHGESQTQAGEQRPHVEFVGRRGDTPLAVHQRSPPPSERQRRAYGRRRGPWWSPSGFRPPGRPWNPSGLRPGIDLESVKISPGRPGVGVRQDLMRCTTGMIGGRRPVCAFTHCPAVRRTARSSVDTRHLILAVEHVVDRVGHRVGERVETHRRRRPIPARPHRARRGSCDWPRRP